MNEFNWPAVIISGFALATLVIKAIIDWKVEERNRRWRIEDQEKITLVMQSHAAIHEELRQNTELTQEAIGKVMAPAELDQATIDKITGPLRRRDPGTRTRSTDGNP